MPKLVLKNRCLSFSKLHPAVCPDDQPSPNNPSEFARSHQMSSTSRTDPTLCYLWKGSKTGLHPCLSGLHGLLGKRLHQCLKVQDTCLNL